MPAFNYLPESFLALQFELSDLAGLELFNDDNGSVVAPSDFEGFNDILDLCHGNGETNNLAVVLAASASVAGMVGDWRVGINSNDRVYIECQTGSHFTVTALDTDCVFGFPTTPLTSITVGGGWRRVTATADWTRGVFEQTLLNATSLLQIDQGLISFMVSLDYGAHQSVVTALRAFDTDDDLIGATVTNLSYLMGNQIAPSYRALLTADGRVTIVRPDSGGILVWVNETLRDWLGFTGLELNSSSIPGFVALTATHRPKSLLWLNRPIEYCEPRVRGLTNSAEASDGKEESKHLSTRKGWDIRVCVTGIASEEDLTSEALDNFFLYFWRAEHFTVYQEKNELRKAVATREGYSLAKCAEDNYRVGRLRLNRDKSLNEFGFDLEDRSLRNWYYFDLRGWDYVP